MARCSFRYFQLRNYSCQTQPKTKQIFVAKGKEKLSDLQFNAKLFAARKITEHEIQNSKISESRYFYLPSFSATTIIYKGLLKPEDIGRFYEDLRQTDLVNPTSPCPSKFLHKYLLLHGI